MKRRHAFPGEAYQTSGGTQDYCGPQESRGKSSVGRRHALGRLSGDACRRDDGLKIIAGGAVFLAPPTHTQANYHQPHRSGGGANLHMVRWGSKTEEDIGWPKSEGW